MPDSKRTAANKRTKPIRDFSRAPDFFTDWKKLERSGKHDMHRLKEAMLLLIANDGPLPPEWKDHELKGAGRNVRECHVKGDLLLVYRLLEKDSREIVTFLRAGTHSEVLP
ncbi:MAG: type II toxin-antitoxin system YafQ family toxin [Synergistaceae bacterium]|nr:type II toxin-antitoxin system YafQ family toxin [Synergistaceae bacterium]